MFEPFVLRTIDVDSFSLGTRPTSTYWLLLSFPFVTIDALRLASSILEEEVLMSVLPFIGYAYIPNHICMYMYIEKYRPASYEE